jgi:sortase A
MMDLVDGPIPAEDDGDSSFSGSPDGGHVPDRMGIQAARILPARVPPARRSRPGGGEVFAVGQYLCLFLAIACLSYYALGYGLARLFQMDQSRRFDRIVRLRPDRSPSHSSALPSRGSGPAAPTFPEGSLIGRVEIPRIGISVMVLEGDSEDILGKAVGHVPTTAFPGGRGNVVIAGHRDTFFRPLREIRKGDGISFTTTYGIYAYQVESIEKVGPQDTQVLSDPGEPTLTLITCYPFNFIGAAPERFVVRASQTQTSRISMLGQSLP